MAKHNTKLVLCTFPCLHKHAVAELSTGGQPKEKYAVSSSVQKCANVPVLLLASGHSRGERGSRMGAETKGRRQTLRELQRTVLVVVVVLVVKQEGNGEAEC